MARRQQRTSNARGKLQPQNVTVATQMDWQITGASNTTATVQFTDPAGVIIVKGIPQFFCNELGEEPVSVSWAEPVLSLTYGEALPSLFTLTIQQYDQAVRTQTGAWVAAGTRQFPADLPSPVTFITSNSNLAAGVCVVDNDSVNSVELFPEIEGTLIQFAIPTMTGAPVECVGSGYSAPQNEGTCESYLFTGGAWVQL
jgi:hypothetical protein